jgi:hypothetical protein
MNKSMLCLSTKALKTLNHAFKINHGQQITNTEAMRKTTQMHLEPR